MSEEDAWIRIAAENAQDANARLATVMAQRDELLVVLKAAWVPCPCCDEYLCTIHGKHVFECECPAIEEWGASPYDNMTIKNPHAVALGRLGGQQTSERKKRSSAENGKKGGRPKKKKQRGWESRDARPGCAQTLGY